MSEGAVKIADSSEPLLAVPPQKELDQPSVEDASFEAPAGNDFPVGNAKPRVVKALKRPRKKKIIPKPDSSEDESNDSEKSPPRPPVDLSIYFNSSGVPIYDVFKKEFPTIHLQCCGAGKERDDKRLDVLDAIEDATTFRDDCRDLAKKMLNHQAQSTPTKEIWFLFGWIVILVGGISIMIYGGSSSRPLFVRYGINGLVLGGIWGIIYIVASIMACREDRNIIVTETELNAKYSV
jgi:hypothetical protein